MADNPPPRDANVLRCWHCDAPVGLDTRFHLEGALADLVAAIRAEDGVSMMTCSGRLHAAVGVAEGLLATLDGR